MALVHTAHTISSLWEEDFIATHFNCSTWFYGSINLGVYESNPKHKCILDTIYLFVMDRVDYR